MSDLRERITDPPTGSGHSGPKPIPRGAWIAAVIIALGAFLGNMDSSIVALGLEPMRVSLQVTLEEIQWVATAYLLGLAAALPLTPWLVRRLGAGRLWMYALAGFLITSAACAVSPSAVLLIGVRGLQGMAAGILVTSGQTVIGLLVGPERLGRMMATLGLVVGLAPVAGPSVGGFLLSHGTWPLLFWLNLPIGLIVLLLGMRFVPRGEQNQPPPMDWTGLALVSLGLPLLVYALTELSSPGNPAMTLNVVLAVIGIGAGIVFIWWSLRGKNPVLQLRLAAHPVMASGLLSVLLAGASMFGAVLLLPLWFQIRLGASIASTGLLLIPLGLGTTVIIAVAGWLTDRYGGGVISLIGSLIVLVSTVPWVWLGPETPMLFVQALLFVRGVGIGLSMMPAMSASYASVRPTDLGDATALANIVMRIGGAVGGSMCVIVLSRGLSADAATGFQAAFVVLGVICLLATGASAWLRFAEKRLRKTQQ